MKHLFLFVLSVALFSLIHAAHAASRHPKILVVTDEPGAQAAYLVQDSFATTAPYPCLNVEVQVISLSREELDCRPHGDGRDRIVLCSSQASRKAQELRRRVGAKKVLIVVDLPYYGGNGGPTPVVTSAAQYRAPKTGMHEIMHTMGFSDTYDPSGQHSVGSGDIMSCTGQDCYVPQEWFSKVARGLGVRLPREFQ